uniref:Uncharacterized protein n=2 Tax=Caenorhabditis japonica TaxID=281687 RepID=A0A8R1E6H5_CAEJA
MRAVERIFTMYSSTLRGEKRKSAPGREKSRRIEKNVRAVLIRAVLIRAVLIRAVLIRAVLYPTDWLCALILIFLSFSSLFSIGSPFSCAMASSSNSSSIIIDSPAKKPIGKRHFSETLSSSHHPDDIVPLSDFIQLRETCDVMKRTISQLVTIMQAIVPRAQLQSLGLDLLISPSEPPSASASSVILSATNDTSSRTTTWTPSKIAAEAASMIDKSQRAVVELLPDNLDDSEQDSKDRAKINALAKKYN